ncbi:MAG TPA: dihydrolipoyllysine-residue acetyltransferase [Pseudomonadota bacterium]|jgi:pyruvate dehydrogenase E2 component (dihydrolipoamide acetyltransferase)|nr:dihydrolipoyllysine-residue acetyltransferase [Pseudomonadota bacterium]
MADLKEARVPDLGGSSEVPVIELLVKVGDTVKKDQGLVTLESDKATMEVPSSHAGVVREIKVKLGDELSEGSLVAIIEASEAAMPPVGAPLGATGDAEVAPRGAHTERVAPKGVPTQSIAAEAAPTMKASAAPTPAHTHDATQLAGNALPYASPSVRLFARELGVDLAKVAGSARGGRITRDDVQNYVKAALAKPAAAAASGGGNGLNLLPWPNVDFSKFGPVESKPLSRIKKISGANLARNWAMIPAVTQFDDADITELEAFRVQLNKENEKAGLKLTMLAFLMKAAVAGLKKFPDFNASLDASGENLTLKSYFHIGFAADTPNGLVVPVIRDVDQKGVFALARETSELAAKAREGKLGPAEMQGGCFSISSLGGIGGTAFTPIINAPEVAILGVSKSSMKPHWNGSSFEPRLTLPLSLSYDHRVIDGAAAARFTSYLAQLLADFRRAML